MNTNRIAIGCLIVYAVAVCVGSVLTDDMALWLTEISIPVMVAATLIYLYRELPFSALSYLSITFLFLLHAVIAIHPIALSPLGFKVGALLGWHRNNADHVLHFMGGLCLWRPVFELVASVSRARRSVNAALSIALVLSLSAGYELLEWKSAVMLGEKTADLLLGWQGDAWDAQKDMALNVAGAVCASLAGYLLRFARRVGNSRKG